MSGWKPRTWPGSGAAQSHCSNSHSYSHANSHAYSQSPIGMATAWEERETLLALPDELLLIAAHLVARRIPAKCDPTVCRMQRIARPHVLRQDSSSSTTPDRPPALADTRSPACQPRGGQDRQSNEAQEVGRRRQATHRRAVCITRRPATKRGRQFDLPVCKV